MSMYTYIHAISAENIKYRQAKWRYNQHVIITACTHYYTDIPLLLRFKGVNKGQ